MAKKKQPKKPYIKIDERKGQVSARGGELANYFMRNVPMWNTPVWQDAEFWRSFVAKQPIAVVARERIASYLNSLDWAIVPRDSEKRDELKGQIKYYTKLLEKGSTFYNDLEFSSHIEFLVKDLHDLPFGAASELGRANDDPNGKVVWIRPIDGGTLAPTLNFNFPVVQQSAYTGLNPVYIPKDFVSRIYLSPRTELSKEGWGFAPPERIYLAMEMLYRGDSYYSQLLLNTPEAGIIDLGDMEKDSALEWVQSLRDLLFGINPLKIPVLYEHTSEAKYIPFGKPPSEIMYDSVTMKYASILLAGYGLTLSDVGIGGGGGSGGDTLAGAIRNERVSKSSGFSTAKKKLVAYFNKILPDSLQFTWIDYDSEENVARGRARLATAQAGTLWVRDKVFKPSEVRQQAIADGLFTITLPETIDPNDPEFGVQEALKKEPIGGSKTQSLGNSVAPSSGGQGEIIPQQVIQRNLNNAEINLSKAAFNAVQILSVLLSNVQKNLSASEMEVWGEYVDDYLVGRSGIEEEKLASVLNDVCHRASSVVETQAWTKEVSGAIAEKVFVDISLEETSRQMFAQTEKAEAEFIAGTRDDMTVIEPELNLESYKSDSEKFIRDKFCEIVSKHVAIVSKSKLLETNLRVDASEATDENIRVSREISREVLQNLSMIIKTVYETGREDLQYKLGETNEVV